NDGLCADAHEFGIVIGLAGPVTWKMKKFTKDTFQDALGSITSPVRFVAFLGDSGTSNKTHELHVLRCTLLATSICVTRLN
ncbi:hypothetical protein GGU11DRAFT_671007, partial [Lentinula aff. detonsa]